MSNTNPAYYQKSSINVQIQYKNAFMTTPIALNEGTGINSIMTIENAQQIINEVTCTGDTVGHIEGVIIRSTMTLTPQSPAIPLIAKVVNDQMTSGLIIPGELTVIGNGFKYTLPQFTFVEPFAGYGLSKSIDDYAWRCEFRPPLGASLSEVVNFAGGLLNFG